VAVSKEIKRLEKSNVSLSVTVPKEDVRAQYDNLLQDYSKNLQLPGFRKGKVPQEVLERKFADALKGEAMSRIIESAMQDIFKDENLPRNERPLPYSAPELKEEPEFNLDKDFQFSVVYDVLPDVKIGQWKDLKVEYPYAEIGDKDINLELDEIRERNAIVMDRDEGAAAQKGDVVTIDYIIFGEDGETQDMQRQDFAFTIGSGTNIYKFDDDIAGMKKGEKKEFKKKFDADNVEPALAGKTRKIQITLTALKEKKLPGLDDDLAQDVDEKFKTLDDLKNSIKERLEKNLEWRLREKKLNEILKKIMADTPVVLPESMIEAEIEGRWRRLARYYNTSVEAIKQIRPSGEAEEKRDREWREAAEKALHSRIIIETLMEEQKIEVTDEDVEKEFQSIAAANGIEVDEVKKHYNEQAVFNLKEDIREQKITDILLAENSLKPGKKENYLDFMTDNS
jgi:trigger factor